MPSKIQFQADDREEHILKACQSEDISLNQVARRDYQRLRGLLNASLPTFSVEEAHFLCEALHKWIEGFTPLIGFAFGELVDTVPFWLASQLREEKIRPWPGIEMEALMQRLEGLHPAACAALWDAIERYWVARARNAQASPHDLLQQVGLVAHARPGSAERIEGSAPFSD